MAKLNRQIVGFATWVTGLKCLSQAPREQPRAPLAGACRSGCAPGVVHQSHIKHNETFSYLR